MATRPTGNPNYAELGGAIVVLAFAAVALFDGLRLPFGNLQAPGAGFLPMLQGGLLGCVGVVLLVQAFRNRDLPALEWPRGEGRRIVVVLAAAIIGFVLLLPVLGFLPAALAFFFVSISSWKQYGWQKCLIIAGCLAILLYTTFVTLLQMPLPTGYFQWI